MKVIVDPEKCLGCGVCEADCPDVFQLGDDAIAKVLLDPVPDKYRDDVMQAVEDCPEEAISVQD
ncbi:MAG: ferredoxin [Anaerolineae bacterium]|nr:ferredoxin [Anaerolineae bacterium]